MSCQTSHGRATIGQLCRAFGLSREAYYAARREPRPARRRAAPAAPRWASVEQLEAPIRQCVEEHPGWGVRKVWATLRRQGLRASHKRVWALMHQWGLVLPPPALRDPQAPRGHVAVPESKRRWGTDLTTTWTRQDGWVAIEPVVECGDRCCLALGASRAQDTQVVLAPVVHALTVAYGTPAGVPPGLELRADHGPQYTGSDCEQLCRDWHVDHTFAPVGRPTGNAVTERFILALKQELLWTRDWESLEELRQALEVWRTEYNYQRPHQALGWRTPAEQRALNLRLPLQVAA
ncbi:MAG: IS3 family transposase [Candidatus Latescibacterota bacterium]